MRKKLKKGVFMRQMSGYLPRRREEFVRATLILMLALLAM